MSPNGSAGFDDRLVGGREPVGRRREGDAQSAGGRVDPGRQQPGADPGRDRVGLAQRLGGGARLAPVGDRLGRPPQDVGLEERGGACRQRRADGQPAGRIVLAGRACVFGFTEVHPPADLLGGELVRFGQALGRGAIPIDHAPRRGRRVLGRRLVAGRPGPDREVGGRVSRGDRQQAEDDRVVDVDEPVEPVEGHRQGGGRIAVPHRDLGPPRA